MGIRFTQPQGISKDAREFLNNHRAHQNDCPHCGRSDIVPAERIGHFEGMCGEEWPLMRYPLSNGGWADEFVQEEYWDSGPVIFLGLRTNDGQSYVWDKKVMNKHCGV